MNEIRADLLQGMAGAAWVMESARAQLYARWGAGEHADVAVQRTAILAKSMERAGLRLPEECLPGHLEWSAAMAGDPPHALGPAMLRRYGQRVDVYARPLVDDPGGFAQLGNVATRIETSGEPPQKAEAFLPEAPVPEGRRVVVLNDVHIGEPGADVIARRAVEDVNALEPDLVLVAGDITDDGEPGQFALASQILDALRAPWRAVLGNHDAVQRSTRLGNGAELFDRAFGRTPADALEVVDGVQFALLDSSDPTPWPLPDPPLEQGGPQPQVGGTASGAYAPGQIEAIAAMIDPSRPALIVQHHELQPFTALPPYQFGVRESDSNALLDALRGHQILGFVAGHTHRSALVEARAATGTEGPSYPLLEVPALKEWPLCFTVLCVQGETVRAQVRQIGDADLVLRAHERMPAVLTRYTLGPLTALAHAFGQPA